MDNLLYKFFKSLDFISPSPQLLAERSTRNKTYVGALFTILISIGVVYITWYFGNDIFYKNNVRFFVREDQDIASYQHSLNSSNFFIGYYLTDDTEIVLPDYDKVLSIEMGEFQNKRNKTSNELMDFAYIKHNATSCNNYRNPSNYFSKPQLNRLSCFENMNFTLGGLLEEDYSRFLAIRMNYC